ncbi:MAG: sigma-70 family RNA polymerase sigma factor [Actinomycetota bacterium]|nr:sigma-70 family RNA polymerase sigma factor [Actinomycetota bacterium]
MSSGPTVEDLLREFAPQVLGVLARRYGDFADAEDAVQEALIAAATRWPAEGVPDNARGWLISVAVRRMTDRLRSEEARRRREDVAALREPSDVPEAPHRDDSLLLLFLCCHPALTPASAIPLTLRAVGGLTTAEIARGFLVPEATMATRISRAKQRIRASDVPFHEPPPHEWAERLRSVLHVLYLIFNESYASSSGPEVAREDLSGEAIRLTRMLRAGVPDDPEVAGLLALMLLTDARRAARTGPRGELVPLTEQDRTRWDRGLIAEGIALVEEALPRGAVGEYQLQAAIAAVHDEAERAEDTDWRQILELYRLLERMTGNPVVTLNRLVAEAMVDGPVPALASLDALADRLPGHHRISAVRAHLLEMAGDIDAAIESFRAAAGRTTSLAERDYLTMRAARLGPGGR